MYLTSQIMVSKGPEKPSKQTFEKTWVITRNKHDGNRILTICSCISWIVGILMTIFSFKKTYYGGSNTTKISCESIRHGVPPGKSRLFITSVAALNPNKEHRRKEG